MAKLHMFSMLASPEELLEMGIDTQTGLSSSFTDTLMLLRWVPHLDRFACAEFRLQSPPVNVSMEVSCTELEKLRRFYALTPHSIFSQHEFLARVLFIVRPGLWDTCTLYMLKNQAPKISADMVGNVYPIDDAHLLLLELHKRGKNAWHEVFQNQGLSVSVEPHPRLQRVVRVQAAVAADCIRNRRHDTNQVNELWL